MDELMEWLRGNPHVWPHVQRELQLPPDQRRLLAPADATRVASPAARLDYHARRQEAVQTFLSGPQANTHLPPPETTDPVVAIARKAAGMLPKPVADAAKWWTQGTSFPIEGITNITGLSSFNEDGGMSMLEAPARAMAPVLRTLRNGKPLVVSVENGMIRASINGRQAGVATLKEVAGGAHELDNMLVMPEFRRQGVMSNVVDVLRKEAGMTIVPSAGQHTADGRAFSDRLIGATPAAQAPVRLASTAPDLGTVANARREEMHRKLAEYVQQADNSAPAADFGTAQLLDKGGVNEHFGKRVADLYEAAKSAPEDPAVRAAYGQFGKEIDEQYRFVTEGLGIKMVVSDADPYSGPTEMMKDLFNNGQIRVFKSVDGDNPLLTGEQNTKFRFVHDVLGHGLYGNKFDPTGEENAFRAHSEIFSPAARPAMATETRGQNSWVNFGPHGEANRATPTNTKYAEQKVFLMPDEYTAAVPTGAVTEPHRIEEIDNYVRQNMLGRGSVHSDNEMYDPDLTWDPLTCTDCAYHLQERFGGRIKGYQLEDNPSALAGSAEEGHDFLVLDGRYIVDPWAKDIWNYTDRVTFDLKNPADTAEIRRLYGDRKNWSDVAEGNGFRGEDAMPEAPPAQGPERVTQAAWKSKDGQIFTGSWHPEAKEKMTEAGATGAWKGDGFVTDTGRFISRKEAAQMGRERSQLKVNLPTLGAPEVTSEYFKPGELGAAELAPLRTLAGAGVGAAGGAASDPDHPLAGALAGAVAGGVAANPKAVLHGLRNMGETGAIGDFTSRLKNAIKSAPFERGSAAQWRAALSANVAKGEREWTGVERLLNEAEASGRPLTRAEIQGVHDANPVALKETLLGADARTEAELWWNDEGGANETKPWDELTRAEREAAVERYQEEVGNYAEAAPKFAKWVEPGGKNYRELLLQLKSNPRNLDAKLTPALAEAHRLKGRYLYGIGAGLLAGQAMPEQQGLFLQPVQPRRPPSLFDSENDSQN